MSYKSSLTEKTKRDACIGKPYTMLDALNASLKSHMRRKKERVVYVGSENESGDLEMGFWEPEKAD